ncbi:MAG TPA: PhnD/SsuA/transferrin family substrate-binding protein [Kofleriaceae bacterium]|jgi:ABC-type phosphate/phosphonate transport system substrate-binding protein|nr:PhnD/SsuA/transferrin family substrate-binding protein [Kofleriaceae bacterium]
MRPFILGAVAYDPKVVTIWEGFRAWLETRGLPFDYVLFSNYEAQVDAHLRGVVDAAWNSPLAWVQTVRAARDRRVEAILMRDTDQDLTSVIVARADGPIRSIEDLRGKRVGVGAGDSPQATLIPLDHLASLGVTVEAKRHDVLLGKHGDHVGGERDAIRALVRGEVEAACILDGNHALFQREGTAAPGLLRIVAQTGAYDHCNMTVIDGGGAHASRFRELLLAMRYDDPEVRPLLDLEGLREWRPGRTSGYALLERAVDRFA